jgi:hypothetical protein
VAGNRHIDAVTELVGRMRMSANRRSSPLVAFDPADLASLELVLAMAEKVDIQHEARARFFKASRERDTLAMDTGAKEQDDAYVAYREAKAELMKGREA